MLKRIVETVTCNSHLAYDGTRIKGNSYTLVRITIRPQGYTGTPIGNIGILTGIAYSNLAHWAYIAHYKMPPGCSKMDQDEAKMAPGRSRMVWEGVQVGPCKPKKQPKSLSLIHI